MKFSSSPSHTSLNFPPFSAVTVRRTANKLTDDIVWVFRLDNREGDQVRARQGALDGQPISHWNADRRTLVRIQQAGDNVDRAIARIQMSCKESS